jgi:hypothetical protein
MQCVDLWMGEEVKSYQAHVFLILGAIAVIQLEASYLFDDGWSN